MNGTFTLTHRDKRNGGLHGGQTGLTLYEALAKAPTSLDWLKHEPSLQVERESRYGHPVITTWIDGKNVVVWEAGELVQTREVQQVLFRALLRAEGILNLIQPLLSKAHEATWSTSDPSAKHPYVVQQQHEQLT